MPIDVAGSVKDKSTWARRGLAVQNTWIDPGWEGYLTLELSNHHFAFRGPPRWLRRQRDEWRKDMAGKTLVIAAGMPIAQIVFERLDEPTELPYRGKYQRQEMGAQPPIVISLEALSRAEIAEAMSQPGNIEPGTAFDGEEL